MPYRSLQTMLAGLNFLCMTGSMISGIILSRYVFAFLPGHGGYEFAGKRHILCAYWGFVLMSIHLLAVMALFVLLGYVFSPRLKACEDMTVRGMISSRR